MTSEIIKRTTITELVVAWKASQSEITKAYEMLVSAENRLRLFFGEDQYRFDLSREAFRSSRFEHPELVMKELKKDVWAALFKRLEIRKFISLKQCAQMDKSIETGEGLPEMEEGAIFELLKASMDQLDTFFEASCREAVEFMLPRREQYKTSTPYDLGKRVILCYAVEPKYGGRGFWNKRENELRQVDTVFHLLDGTGITKTYRGELGDAIEASPDGIGETPYFRFRCCRNHNLHLEFKRADLVEKLKRVASGNRLKRETGQTTEQEKEQNERTEAISSDNQRLL